MTSTLMLSVVLVTCGAQEAAAEVAPATHVTEVVPAPDPEAERWLDRIEKRFGDVKSLHADLVYRRIDGVDVLDDKQTHKGTIVFVVGPPAKFSVNFVKLIVDRRPVPQDVWYIFDGQWLVESNRTEKIFTKDQIVPPDAPAEQANPLASGRGPFYLPINARKKEVLQRFHVTLKKAAKSDPPNSLHFELIPRAGRQRRITRIDLWYDRETLLPVRAETLDTGPNQSIVIVKNAAVNRKVDPKRFDVSVPRGRGWRTTVRPYKKPE